MAFLRRFPGLILLVVLAVLGVTHVIGEPVWFIVVGAFVLVELVIFMVRLDRNASR